MASQIDISGLTLNPEEASEIGKLIIEKALVGGALAEIHDIQTGIQHKQQIPFAGRLGDGLKAASGCTPNSASGVALTEKFWDPSKYDARWIHCADDLNNLLKLFKKASRVNPDFYDRIDSQEMGVLYALIEQMLVEVMPEKIWFSDKNADLHSGTGVFATGTDLDLYNVIDGIWKEIFADGAIPTVAITENAGVSYAAQLNLATDKAFDTFVAMRKAADSRLLEDPNIQLLVTRTLAENYRDTLRTKTLGAGFIETTENGKTVLKFDGIPIKVMHVWDRFIQANEKNGTVYNLPHRALLTTPDNIPVGTLASEDLESFDSFYDKTLKSNIVDVAFSIDAKHLQSYMSVAAYPGS